MMLVTCEVRNGLQALTLHDCRYAYYIHCLAHRSQLTLVIASRSFPHLSFLLKIGFYCECRVLHPNK